MANEEALVLDTLALNDGTTLGMISFDAPVPRQRPDWIGGADSEAQLLVRNPLHENRKITVRLAVVPQASMNVAHDKILLVLDKLQKASKYQDGISMTWTPATGTRTATFDVLSGEIVDLPIDWENGWLAFSPQITVELTCKPYWRGTETLTSTASSSTPFVTLEVASVTGDVPALGRLIITDTATQSRRHVEWGLEGPLTYNSGTSLLIDSDNMVTSGFSGAQTTKAGAYDPNASGNSCINISQLLPVPQAVAGTGNLSHVGVFRVKARVFVQVTTPEVRFAWRANDGPLTRNEWASPPAANAWSEVDLGTITVPVTLSGTQRWTGQIEAQDTTVGSGDFYVDYLELVPVSDGYGKARATYAYSPGVIVGRDSFVSTTATNPLGTRAAPAGGSWAVSGDATDFAFSDSFGSTSTESIVRSTTAVETNGRYAILGTTNYTDTEVSVRGAISGYVLTTVLEQAVIARWTDSSNYLRLTVKYFYPTSEIRLEQVVAGTATTLASAPWSLLSAYRLRLLVFASGRAIGQISDTGGAVVAEVQAVSSTLATGGTLETGKPGLRDKNVQATPGNRFFTDFAVATPTAEPIALYSGRTMQIRYDDVFRQDSTGTYTGRPASYRGTRCLLPPGTSRIMVKARRNDIDVSSDENVTDALQIQVGWTPRGLAVPRS
jgi:hypothetical protein